MTDEEINTYISKVFWRTSVDGSHQYTLSSWTPDLSEAFNKFVVHIRRHGYIEKFTGREYTYFDVVDYQYWSMGAPLEETILINRAKLKIKNVHKNDSDAVVIQNRER
ncbi:MAG: hypothetical protein EHM85_03805 [Desulfobacteraceae bacterium]|nr:MAG: hypothetical protein EHM85_03805 [Desulfobacteraceae bacterium]